MLITLIIITYFSITEDLELLLNMLRELGLLKSGLFKPNFEGQHHSKTRSEEWGIKERRG